MNKNLCKYQEDIEYDYDVLSGHSSYETICSKTGERCLFYYYNKFCKDQEDI